VFPPYRFYPDRKVYVQITVSHFNLNDSETVHDAVTTWIEDVNAVNFTVCAMQAGRTTKNFNPNDAVDWMAYQGSPTEGLAGVVMIQKWWSGTNCADVTFPKVGLRRLERVFSCTRARKHTRQSNDSKLAHRKLNLA